MKKIIVVGLLSFAALNTSFAANKEFADKFGKDMDSFCKVSDWKKGLHTKDDIGYDLYKTLKIAQPVDAKFAIDKLKKDGWIVLDARDKLARKAAGKVSGALLVTADYKDDSKNEFKKDTILKKFAKNKFKKHLAKRSIASITKTADMVAPKYLLFCNGYKCHRSSWGACQLRKQGVPYENISIALGGFSALKDAGADLK